MENTNQLSRRSFLVSGATALGGLMVAFHMPSPFSKILAAEAGPVANNAFIKIAPDNTITIVINRLEMGQGVHTSMAQLIAEELEVDWRKIKSESSNSDKVYNDPMFHMIMTGGSTSVAHSWKQYRTVGAGMREMLLEAAAKKWNVKVSELKAKEGFIHHPKKGKVSYGELALEANKLKFPENPKLKDAKEYKVIGKSQKRVDAVGKSDGTAIFGMDIRLPGMLYAAIARPSVSTAKLKSANIDAAKKVPGVVDVFKINDNKIAIIAKNTYQTRMGQEALEAKWETNFPGTDQVMNQFRELSKNEGKIAKEAGKIEADKIKTKIEAEYEFPFLAHAAMEPLNCTINFDGKNAELWGGFQMPTMDHVAAQKVLGIPHENIKFNVTYAGGSFGRRASKHSDWIVDACEIAKVLKKPVKLVYTREDDMKAGYYRPMVFHKVNLGLNEKNLLESWNHHVVGQSIAKGSIMEGFVIKDGIESVLMEGVNDTHYAIPNIKVEQSMADSPLTTLWWRSVGHTHTAYVMETMIDELAFATKQDPLEMRLKMLEKSPRHVAVLNLLKKKSDWGKYKAPKGHALGIAVHESFGSVVGHVAEVSVENGVPRVHKVWSAVHCGMVVNPDGAATQVEGAIAMGISAALYQQIQLKDGEIVQKNFDEYEVVRMDSMPKVMVSFVETSEAPTGIGEPGVPPIAPAVANALFKLTGKRLRKLPFSRELKA
jgi:isoquinoline 1-oxidoreductase subunit beta